MISPSLRDLTAVTLVLALLGVGGTRATPGDATGQARSPEARTNQVRGGSLELLIPLYVHPSEEAAWSLVVEAARRIPVTVVVNPASGPGGTELEADYRQPVDRLRRAGVRVLGYVRTEYGARAAGAVKSDVDAYAARYRVDGVFLDEVNSRAAAADYYAELQRHVHSRISDGFFALNPGTHLDETYLRRSLCDVAVVFEDVAANWLGHRPDDYVARYGPGRFGALVHGCRSVEEMRLYIDLVVARGFRYVIITDRTLPSPWNRLPSYWEAEVEHIASLNRSGKGGRSDDR